MPSSFRRCSAVTSSNAQASSVPILRSLVLLLYLQRDEGLNRSLPVTLSRRDVQFAAPEIIGVDRSMPTRRRPSQLRGHTASTARTIASASIRGDAQLSIYS